MIDDWRKPPHERSFRVGCIRVPCFREPCFRVPCGSEEGQIAALTLTATTAAPGATVTIARMTPAAGKSLTIQWGDGNTTVVAAGDILAKTNVYVAAGTYPITITNAADIVGISLLDTKLSGLKSSQLTVAAGMTYFEVFSIGNATAGRFDSADVVDWRPTTFYLRSLPAGYAGTFNSADVVDWRPTTFYLYAMPAGYAIAVAAADFAAWTTTTAFLITDNGFSQAQVDAILWGLYQATISRTVNGGAINVGGTNAAPSGVYQAAAACPVTVATPGKEVCHELLNDTCGSIAAGETWATVTFTA